MPLDWQVLLFASIAITLRFAAVCTQLGRVEVEGRQLNTDKRERRQDGTNNEQ